MDKKPSAADRPGDVVEDFVAAVNSGRPDRVTDLFTEDAVVNDQLVEYRGLQEIGQWAERDVIGAALSIKTVSLRAHYGSMIMIAHVDGDFDKRGLPDPLIYKFYFAVSCGRIVLLLMLREEL